jgi:hypothetical protein
MKKSTKKTWLLLIHQIPPKPDYFRVKIWRRLQQVGAAAIKQSVYILPNSESAYEDFSWILKEITEGGGDANLSEVRFMEGLTDKQVVALFQEARQSDYEKLIKEIHALRDEISKSETSAGEAGTKFKARLGKLQKRLDDTAVIDFFDVPQRIATENALFDLMSKIKDIHGVTGTSANVGEFVGKIWVTRKNVYVDRMASAWLITRFIDKGAKFKVVGSKHYAPQKKDEVRFDMYAAEFTHEGDQCTFETMIQRFGIKNKALQIIAEIVHDIDLKDGKFGRPEIDGLSVVLSGIAATQSTDDERLRRSAEVFDDLYAFFKSKK